MNTVPRYFLVVIGCLIVGLAFWGCEGPKGPAGPSGVNPQMPPVITGVVATPDSVGSGETSVLFVIASDPNGDSLTFSWSADSGQLSSTNTAATIWTAPRALGLYQIRVSVSDDNSTVSDSIIVGVNVYVPSVFPSYLGDDANRCGHCHEAYVEGWHGTNHGNAYQTLVDDGVDNNPYCVQCHVTGYDNIVDEAGNVTQMGLDNGGYDDNPIETLRDVQCEACHGPMGPTFGSHNPQLQGALRGETCGRCHTENDEYAQSVHGQSIANAGGLEEFLAEWNRSSCQPCHISEGFIKAHDPDWANQPLPEEPWQVTCATCHDVHEKDNESYLRAQQAFSIVYGGPEYPDGFQVTDFGKGQLCGQCHHARYTESQVLGQIDAGSSHPGPHHSAQSDMLSGYGSYEIPGYEYEHESQHTPDVQIGDCSLENMCVMCHMYAIPFGESGGPYYGHQFNPDTRACNCCHATPDDFDYHGKLTEIDDLTAQLYALLPQDGSGNLMPYDTLNWTRTEREAGYAWYFVTNDGSRGAHNYEYAHSLLENAIAYLTADGAQASNLRKKR
jgi:hypothetical protein